MATRRSGPSNAEIEMRWVNAWNDLYELVGARAGPCRLPDGALVDVDACKAYLQQSVYEGWNVKVDAASDADQVAVVVSRWR